MKALKILVGSGAMLLMLGRTCLKNADNIRHIPINQLDNSVRYLDDMPRTGPSNTFVLPNESVRPRFKAENKLSGEDFKDLIELEGIRKQVEEDTTVIY